MLAWNSARIVANAATTMSSSESKWVSVEGPSTGFRQTIEIGQHHLVGELLIERERVRLTLRGAERVGNGPNRVEPLGRACGNAAVHRVGPRWFDDEDGGGRLHLLDGAGDASGRSRRSRYVSASASLRGSRCRLTL